MKVFASCLVAAAAVLAVDARAEGAAETSWTWEAQTQSSIAPSASELSDHEAELQRTCGVPEAGLRRAAKKLVERKAANLPYLDTDGLGFALRASGEPHVWPRAWIVSAHAMDHESTVRKLAAWRQTFHDLGERRCGVATGWAADGTQIVAVIALDAIADLVQPLATRAHVGTWLTVDARVTVPATGARVVVVGPGGEPHAVPSSFDGTRVVARFAPDRAGAFTVQLVADVATGPRPALEAQVFADEAPPTSLPNLVAPGENAAAGITDERAALAKMLGALRTENRLAPLSRDARLDAVALAHAQRMMQARVVGHDVGDGDPSQRLQSAGLSAQQAGENVAHAQTVALAHRALYASPSHRANMIRAEFSQVGVAVVDDPDGSVWVAEVFAQDLK